MPTIAVNDWSQDSFWASDPGACVFSSCEVGYNSQYEIYLGNLGLNSPPYSVIEGIYQAPQTR